MRMMQKSKSRSDIIRYESRVRVIEPRDPRDKEAVNCCSIAKGSLRAGLSNCLCRVISPLGTMTTFTNGPAKGQTLLLRRSPVYLRVVFDSRNFDALDQPDDEPRRNERVYIYELQETKGHVFLDGPKCRGCFAIASYSMVLNPPNEATMRDTDAWAQWCATRGMPEHLRHKLS